MKLAIVFFGHGQSGWAEMIAEEIEATFDFADEDFVDVLFQTGRRQCLVDRLHRTAQMPAGRGEDENVVHEADIEQARPLHRQINMSPEV
jgi:hypothetical protein